MRIGFLVNPVAGMGGAVGLKGTDGDDILRQALARGAQKISPARAVLALEAIHRGNLSIDFLTCSGEMGEDELHHAGFESRVIYRPAGATSSQDTKDAAKTFVREGVELILFAGGDGTARDILDAVNGTVPMVGIPSGVKMHSAVFAFTPWDVAELLATFSRTGSASEAEVVDIDEDKFRAGVLSPRLFGLAKVPTDPEHVQSGKEVYHSGQADDEADEIAQYVSETMEKGVVYIIGPGGTTERIARHMGLRKTLLGVDAILDGELLIKDASESDLLEMLNHRTDAMIIVTPIGSQGLFLGRGNQQISPRVVRAVGKDRVVVIATPTKLKRTPDLRTDTGDGDLDALFRGRIKVITGYKRKKIVPVV